MAPVNCIATENIDLFCQQPVPVPIAGDRGSRTLGEPGTASDECALKERTAKPFQAPKPPRFPSKAPTCRPGLFLFWERERNLLRLPIRVLPNIVRLASSTLLREANYRALFECRFFELMNRRKSDGWPILRQRNPIQPDQTGGDNKYKANSFKPTIAVSREVQDRDEVPAVKALPTLRGRFGRIE
jgi:hypothetical protein